MQRASPILLHQAENFLIRAVKPASRELIPGGFSTVRKSRMVEWLKEVQMFILGLLIGASIGLIVGGFHRRASCEDCQCATIAWYRGMKRDRAFDPDEAA